MSKLFLTPIDLGKLELLQARVQNLSSAPGSPVEGQIYYDTTLKQFGCYQDTAWVYLAVSGTGNVTQASNSGGAGRMKVSDGANKVVSDYAGGAGLVKSDANGVVSAAAVGADYATGASTNTFTNKTIDANGTGNSISNLETADFAANVIDTDTALAANSDTRLATQKAVKAYVDALLNAQDALVFKGVIDCSANPNYPAANAGYVYKVSVAGKIGGASGIDVTAGDTLYCITDGSAAGNHATVGANWVIVQANVDSATTTTTGLVELATQAETEAKSDTVRAVTPVSLVNFPIKKTFTIGDGSTTALACTHSLGTKDVVVSIYAATGDAEVIADIVHTSTSVVTITFAVAPATNAYKVVIIG